MSRPLKDLHLLPKVRDSWSYLYVEHAKIDQDQKAIAIHDASGKVPVPCASLTTLMLGPGTSISHAAIRSLADNGCLVIWSGEEGVRYYAQGMGETRSARNLYRQAALWADPATHLEVVYRMYRMRFGESLPASTPPRSSASASATATPPATSSARPTAGTKTNTSVATSAPSKGTAGSTPSASAWPGPSRNTSDRRATTRARRRSRAPAAASS